MTKPARFSATDLIRAVKAAERAGMSVARVRVEPSGAIEIIAGEAETADNANWFAGSPLYKEAAA